MHVRATATEYRAEENVRPGLAGQGDMLGNQTGQRREAEACPHGALRARRERRDCKAADQHCESCTERPVSLVSVT